MYYVRSSQPTHRRYAGSGETETNHYEVRLKAWNCTCPAFSFAAFGPEGENSAQGNLGKGYGQDVGNESVRWGDDKFGGLILGKREVPVCKHILACFLVERGGGFGGSVEERIVGRKEMAGWAAGWGG